MCEYEEDARMKSEKNTRGHLRRRLHNRDEVKDMENTGNIDNTENIENTGNVDNAGNVDNTENMGHMERMGHTDLLTGLNAPQTEAVMHTEGPLLILAGAGSGKTRVLTHRIAYLIRQCGVRPWNILAITFTNKAAQEMRQRVDALVGFGADQIWVSTFHSSCVRMLRRFIDRLGYQSNFTIYDADDQKTLMRDLCKRMNIDTKKMKERTFIAYISSAKNKMKTPGMMMDEARQNPLDVMYAQVYEAYEHEMRQSNALDFDDLLLKTVELLEKNEDVRLLYQEQFRYVHVDEYQDTNGVQFKLVKLLTEKYKNVCVVGDDDQSIYRFRGADIRNILDFERAFPNARVIKLEQNYRSTKSILDAANTVIANNTERKEKKLWTENEAGFPISYRCLESDTQEAEYVCGQIKTKVSQGASYGDCAILYRTNMQSRALEERLIAENIPYKIIGGIQFYGRREIKDILAYMRAISNERDTLSLKRVINVPRRGIGAATVLRLDEEAIRLGLSMRDVIRGVHLMSFTKAITGKIEAFAALMEHLYTVSDHYAVEDLIREILNVTGYENMLREDDDWEERLDNIQELIGKAVEYTQESQKNGTQPTLSGFLEEVSLVADIDSMEEETECVLLMTLHSAKGLEFPHVWMTGMEDGLFPGYMSLSSEDGTELEEERRLCYVGITRARETLSLTGASRRFLRGSTNYQIPSRFLSELPGQIKENGGSGPGDGSGGKDGYAGNHVTLPWDSPFETSGAYQTGRAKKTDYGHARAAFHAKPFALKGKQMAQMFAKKNNGSLPYSTGDRVSHIKYGEGVVREITQNKNGTGEYSVTVEFDTVGIRKMAAAFAKLRKL